MQTVEHKIEDVSFVRNNAENEFDVVMYTSSNSPKFTIHVFNMHDADIKTHYMFKCFPELDYAMFKFKSYCMLYVGREHYENIDLKK